uniref:Cytochrome n=2 Tax=Macrostomum lignano TaxID=282301 RepID=A0A1I8J369_9PLAT
SGASGTQNRQMLLKAGDWLLGCAQNRPLLLLTGVASGAAAVALLLRAVRRRKKSEPPLPPGPRGWPVLGSLPSMDPTRMHESIARLCDQYGPLISYRLGAQRFVIVNDLAMADEMLQDENYTGRCQAAIFQRQSGGCGLLFSEGPLWKMHRRLALRTLRDFGFARDGSAKLIDSQTDDILADLREASESGSPVKVLDTFSEASNAVIATLTLGRQFKRGDPDLDFIRSAASGLFATRPLQGLSFLFPQLDWLVRLIPDTSDFTRLVAANQEFIRGQIRQRRELMGADVEAFQPECLCDVYIQERSRAEARGDFETFKDQQIISVVMDLFFAGTDTTARSLEWLMLYAAFEPAWQAKVHAELDKIVGRERRPLMRDKDRLPVTCAVIEEVYRLVSLSPLGMFHRAVGDGTVFRGYRIPSDALIFPFVYGMSRDAGVWPRPDEFLPERFLTAEGNFDRARASKNVPFSLGLRACAGRSLARMQVYLVFAAVLQRFRVRLAAGAIEQQRDVEDHLVQVPGMTYIEKRDFMQLKCLGFRLLLLLLLPRRHFDALRTTGTSGASGTQNRQMLLKAGDWLLGCAQNRPLLLLTGVASGAAAVALLLRAVRRRKKSEPPLPPGPRGWPVLGSLPSMDPTRMHESIARLCDQYGPLISYRLGAQRFVIVNDLAMADEMLQDENYTGRCQAAIFQRQSGGCGLLFSEGPLWKMHRRLALRTLRDFGFARDGSAKLIDSQTDDILADLREASESGSPVKVLDTFSEASNAVIATLTLGRQFKRGDPDLDFIRSAASGLFATRPLQGLSFLFPQLDWLVRLIPDTSDFTRLVAANQEFIRGQIRQRRELMGADVEAFQPECLCDVYIQERSRAEARGDFETFKDQQIISVVMDLFFAGTDTTARSLEWLMLYAAFEPAWQAKVHAELDKIVGRERRPLMRDKDRLPVTCAVIEEVYRLVSLSPLGMFHRAVGDGTVFRGYRIPSDALIFPFVYGMSRDAGVWPRPDEFLPERFLTAEGNFDRARASKNVPFSLGLRACAGRSLARMQVYLVFAAVLQRFRVRLAA